MIGTSREILSNGWKTALLLMLAGPVLAAPPLRIATYNVLEGFSGGRTQAAGAEWIRAQGLDVLALQELNGFTEARLAALAATWGHSNAVLLKQGGYPVGLTARLPIVVRERHLKGLWHGCLQARVGDLEVFVVHLHPGDFAFRQREQRLLAEAIRPLLAAGRPVVVVGDFNAHSAADRDWLDGQEALRERRKGANLDGGRFDYSVLAGFAGLGLADVADGFLPRTREGRISFPTRVLDHAKNPADQLRFAERIDFILASSNLAAKATGARIGRDAALDAVSDHYPLIADFAWPRVQVPVSPLADALEYMGPGARETNYTFWCVAPAMDDTGRTHLFCARWPEANVDPAWRKSSEIAHYVGERPEGPFVFRDVAVKGSGVPGSWDRYTAHNSEISRFGDTYALLYISNSDFHQPPHPLNQKVGMMTSKSLDGPWVKAGKDGLMLDNQPGHFSEGRQVVNPTLLKVGDKFHLYYKTAAMQAGRWRTVFGLAIADRIDGPYVHQPEPVTAAGVVIEDASAFLWDGKVCLLTTDNHGLVTGLEGALALWVSEDGIHFKPEWTQLGMRLFPDYLPAYDPAKVKRVYGNKPKAERPKVLVVDGKPAWLYVASGWIYDGWPRCETHVFRINLPPGAGPLPKGAGMGTGIVP